MLFWYIFYLGSTFKSIPLSLYKSLELYQMNSVSSGRKEVMLKWRRPVIRVDDVTGLQMEKKLLKNYLYD